MHSALACSQPSSHLSVGAFALLCIKHRAGDAELHATPVVQAVDIEIQAREIMYHKNNLNKIMADYTGQPFEKVCLLALRNIRACTNLQDLARQGSAVTDITVMRSI